ncbi:hypothetical protein AB0G74_12585 [Streptomyces sp. NPDC020875]|uniref:hypothetical protein n=1 Tax=Streptomyces sp. NPDC020875 TaxID=3154898 RepID=UPI00340F7A60
MSDPADEIVRTNIRAHQDGGGPITRLFETGAIGSDLLPALDAAAARAEDQGDHEGASRIGDVISYAATVGDRPAVPNWPTC